LAGELKKPDGLMVLSQSDVPAKIKSVEVSKLCGVGRKLEKHLKELGIKTCGDLYVYPREKLVERFGPFCGEHLWQMGQGRDNSPVLCAAAEEAAKSMGHSYTLLHSTSDRDEVKGYLLRLAEQVGRRLRRAHYKGKVVHLSLGFGNFHFWGKQKKVGDYLDDGYDIFKVAATLFDRRQATGDTRQMRFVGVTISGLVHNVDQISLLPQREEKKRIAQAVDALNDRFGESTVERAATLKTIIHQKTGMAPPNLYK
jgi:nucleotidyltransferase/DNA polymerase involved in DNA repair